MPEFTIYEEIPNVGEVPLTLEWEFDTVQMNYPSSGDPFQPAEEPTPSIVGFEPEFYWFRDASLKDKKLVHLWINANSEELDEKYKDSPELWDSFFEAQEDKN